jgi:hypothetical protein
VSVSIHLEKGDQPILSIDSSIDGKYRMQTGEFILDPEFR